jgi:hypothetical protein
MDTEYDPEHEAVVAMQHAAAAHGAERQRWIELAQTWLEVARTRAAPDARSAADEAA